MRYVSLNPKELEKAVGQTFKEIKLSTDEYHTFKLTIELSENLTILKREKEAIRILGPYLKTSPAEATSEDTIWLYLNYATANQYIGNTYLAEEYFNKALNEADRHQIDGVKHFVYHHYGRFLVEKKQYKVARTFFTDALSIRKRLNLPNAVNSQKAIDEIDKILSKTQNFSM